MPPRSPRLDASLVLCAFIYDQVIGIPFADLQQLLRGARSEPGGVSAYADALRTRAGLKLAEHEVLRYDANIAAALNAINRRRETPVELKYFQYLAAFNTELMLDRISGDRTRLLRELNAFVASANVLRRVGEQYPRFEPGDFNKLALWMATGSGKTLLLHLNYHQYLHYFPQPENILLITPNEGLSEQHERELIASSIPCERWRGTGSATSPSREPATVLIIEITKFRENGAGQSVNALSFTPPNLVFVDEGHKGIAGDAWVNIRDTLGKDGFTFEYSATFGQAVHATARTRQEPLDVYAKSIVFDYSYRFFYEDGYGKEFAITTLPDAFDDKLTQRFLLAGLLTFYRQRADFAQHADELYSFRIAEPLAMFVGTYVNAVSRSGDDARSDVLDVVLFLRRCLEDRTWAVGEIQRILEGRSELRKAGRDVFSGRFADLAAGLSAEQIYDDLLRRVFNADDGASLSLVEIAQAEGEIGLRAGQQQRPFGVINIGDRSAFLKLAAEARYGLKLTVDRLGTSLFDLINSPDSPITMVIGSKKFIEGWNSWRVSTMGLLNIGKSEGSQIIQLFGRGVRLRGYSGSLQRSIRPGSTTAPPVSLAPALQRLEQLGIFGVRADYMRTFQEYLRNEGVDPDATIELIVPVRRTHEAMHSQLMVPALRDGDTFGSDERIELQAEPKLARVEVKYKRDIATLSSFDEGDYGLVLADTDQTLTQVQLALLDWNELYNAALQHKRTNGYGNYAISVSAIRSILHTPATHSIVGPPELLRVNDYTDVVRVQSIAEAILLKYIDTYYSRRSTQWASQRLENRTVDQVSTLIPPLYSLKVRERNAAYLAEIEAARDRGDLYTTQLSKLPQLFIEQHLYQPLLTADAADVKISPVGLNQSESKFLEDLRLYLEKPRDRLAERTMYLLRNPSRDKGIRFFGTSGFYPDFILWILSPTEHKVIFVDPKGLLRLQPNFQDEKVRLAHEIKVYEERLQPANGPKLVFESFLDSETRRHELDWQVPDGSGGLRNATIEDFRKHHVLFQHDEDHVALLFELIDADRVR